MRYLNRIVFINSARVMYAKIKLDGNIHFIGTQGVGKSTLLRAILFFYNADTLKLGIPKGKKSFAEYYFPYPNSYIIYEVARTNGAYCVLAYKAGNKVCFRFIDTGYERDYFISNENKAREGWGAIVQQLDANNIYYTKRKIDSYNEYRDILYGNNSGKAKELKRFALIESKNYQNIPRTIQNVFLNSELKAEFIKDTIIKSLGNDIRIELSNYTHHLKGFELQLSEIKRFRDIKTIAQAKNISALYKAVKELEAEKVQLANMLAWAVDKNSAKEPELRERLLAKRLQEDRLKVELKKISELFVSKEKEITARINVFDDSIRKAKNKAAEYKRKNIEAIIRRVSQKPTLEKESRDLLDERTLLTARFQELAQKYQALQKELDNQFSEFYNLKESEKLTVQTQFQDFKSTTTDEFEQLTNQIRVEHRTEVAEARHELDAKIENTHKLKIEREKIKQKRFHENEIENCKKELKQFEEDIQKAETAIERLKGKIETLQKQWEIDKENIRKTEARESEKIKDKISSTQKKVEEIDSYLAASKTSLYGWLTEQYPGWENTIGKVIDVKNVLFNTDLYPKLIDINNQTLFGVALNVNEIDKKVKTVADYQQEKQQHAEHIKNLQQSVNELLIKSASNKDYLKKKYQPEIRKANDGIRKEEHDLERNNTKTAKATLELHQLFEKAQTEKKGALEAIEASIAESAKEKATADEKIVKIEHSINQLIDEKTKERNNKIAAQKSEFEQAISRIAHEVAMKEEATQKRKEEIQAQRQHELAHKGADTTRLAEIEQRLSTVKQELGFIEKNRDTVVEYNKDKRELFDKVADFEAEKIMLESKLAKEKYKSDTQKQSILGEFDRTRTDIKFLDKTLEEIATDREKFEIFSQSDCYATIQEYFKNPHKGFKAEKRVARLIDEVKEVHYDRLNTGIESLRRTVTNFLGKFSQDNVFNFRKEGDDTRAYLRFAEDLSEFIEQDKIAVLEKEVNERFALIIQTIGKETTALISKEGEIQSVITKINRDFVERNFAGVIKRIELTLDQSKNEVVQLLKSIKTFNDENALRLGPPNLFSSGSSNARNHQAVNLLKQFLKKIGEMRKDEISLSDSFELKFRIEENENSTGWVEKLSNVGSEGTDVLVKAMINIMLLNVFKEGASRRFKDFQLHCMMDEIGKLHPGNVRGILKFANDRNIQLINSSPTENDALAFKHIYKLEKDKNSITKVKRIITQNSPK